MFTKLTMKVPKPHQMTSNRTAVHYNMQHKNLVLLFLTLNKYFLLYHCRSTFNGSKFYYRAQRVGVSMVGSSRPEVFCKNGVLKNFAKFTGKHLCKSLFFNKVANRAQVFSCDFCEIFKDTLFW